MTSYIFVICGKNKIGDTMFYYLNTFLIYSMFGFLIETTLKTFFFHSMNNGILMGPWIPVYGFGVMIIVFITRYVFRHSTRKVPKWLKLFIIFMTVFVVLTILEFIGGIIIEKLFHKVFWDYTNFKFHFGHYISLEMSALWGVLSIIFLYLVKPWMDKIIKKIPKWLTILVFIIFMIDVFITFL